MVPESDTKSENDLPKHGLLPRLSTMLATPLLPEQTICGLPPSQKWQLIGGLPRAELSQLKEKRATYQKLLRKKVVMDVNTKGWPIMILYWLRREIRT